MSLRTALPSRSSRLSLMLLLAVSVGSAQTGRCDDSAVLLSLGAQLDNDGNYGGFGALDWSVNKALWFSAHGALSKPQDGIEASHSTSAGLGAGLAPTDWLSLAVGHTNARRDDFENGVTRATLTVSPGALRVSAIVERSDVDASILITVLGRVVQLRRHFDVDGFGGAVAYDFDNGLSLSAQYIEYDYPFDERLLDPESLAARLRGELGRLVADSRLDRRALLTRLTLASTSATSSATTLLTDSLALNASLDIAGRQRLALGYFRDTSVIDGAKLNTLALGWTVPINTRQEFDFSAGSSDIDGNARSFFAGIAWYLYL